MTNSAIKPSKRAIKIAILISSTLQLTIMGIAVAIAPMMEQFPNASPTAIMSIATIPALISVPVQLFVSARIPQLGKRLPLLLGIAIIGIGGLFPAFMNPPLALLLLSSVLIGIGYGFIIPGAYGLITDNFEGLEAGTLMGQQSAFINLGAMVLSVIAGYLCVARWQNTFLIHLYALPVFIITLLCVPKDKKIFVTKEGSGARASLSKEVYVMAATIFVYAVTFGVINTNFSLLLAEKGLGTPVEAGVATSVMTGIGILIGILYGRLLNVFGRFMLPISIALVSAGMLIIGCAPSVPVIYAGSLICGVGYTMVMPTGLFRSSQSVEQSAATYSMSAYLSAYETGYFVSPFILNPLSTMFADGSATSRYFLGAAILLALACFGLAHVFRSPMVGLQK